MGKRNTEISELVEGYGCYKLNSRAWRGIYLIILVNEKLSSSDDLTLTGIVIKTNTDQYPLFYTSSIWNPQVFRKIGENEAFPKEG